MDREKFKEDLQNCERLLDKLESETRDTYAKLLQQKEDIQRVSKAIDQEAVELQKLKDIIDLVADALND